jgi:multidrug efflux system membrane fusion protein
MDQAAGLALRWPPAFRRQPGDDEVKSTDTMNSRFWSALVVLTVLAVGCREERPPPPPAVVAYETVQALSDHDARAVETYIGMIRGENETDLSFKVGGILEQIGPAPGKLWGEGDAIEPGQVLAELKQVDFKAERDSAEARATLASGRLKRGQQLLDDQAISPQEFDVLKAANDEAEAAFQRAEQAFRDSKLVAPLSGRVLARLATTGETVMAGRPVLRIADLSTVSVELGVSDRIVNEIRPGQAIPLVVSSLEGRRFDGLVSEVGVAARQGARLFKVVVKVDNPDGVLRSGMTASATFQARRRHDRPAVLVRLSTLVARSPGGQPGATADRLAVFVVGEDQRVREVPVETGDLVRSSVEVTDGLRPGDKVVVVGAARLQDGERVDARPFVPARRR